MRRMLQGRRLSVCLLIQRRCRILWDLGGGLALPSLGQIFHRSEIQIQKLLVILRHVGGPDVRRRVVFPAPFLPIMQSFSGPLT